MACVSVIFKPLQLQINLKLFEEYNELANGRRMKGQERLQPQYMADYHSPSFEDKVSENKPITENRLCKSSGVSKQNSTRRWV
jgi:hypothetical protein